MVIIAYNYEGKVISIVNAVSLQIANAYWQGVGLPVNSTKTLDDASGDFIPLSDHPTGVYPILKTEEVDGYHLNQFNKDKKYILVTK